MAAQAPVKGLVGTIGRTVELAKHLDRPLLARYSPPGYPGVPGRRACVAAHGWSGPLAEVARNKPAVLALRQIAAGKVKCDRDVRLVLSGHKDKTGG